MNPLNPRPTPFDLSWRMFGVHVRVHPGFWLFSAGFGYLSGMANDKLNFWGVLAAWVVCTFLSVLFHELGHVVMGRLCGQKGNIVLHAFGGAAVGQYQLTRRWQQMAIALAGPAAGLLLFATVWVLFMPFRVDVLGNDVRGPQLMRQWDPGMNRIWLWRGVNFLLLMTLMWNVLNLIPVIPMDGGQVVRALFRGYTSPNGLRCALVISMVAAGCIAGYSFMAFGKPDMYPAIPEWALLIPIPGARLDPTFNAIFFAILAAQNLFMLLSVKRQMYSTEAEDQDNDADRERYEDRRDRRDRDRELERDRY